MEDSKPRSVKPKVKELKVLDGKTAQNIGTIPDTVCTIYLLTPSSAHHSPHPWVPEDWFC